MKKRVLAVLLGGVMMATCMGGFGSSTKAEAAETTTDEETTAESKADGEKPLVALVANQAFGDGSSIDQMLEGLEKVSADYDLDYTTLESLDAANYYDDISALCEEGADVIITTFGYMSEAVLQCAEDYPDVMQIAIYQDIEGYDNIYSTSWRTEKGLFMSGVIAASMSKSGQVGFILGAEEPAANNEANGFMEGVYWTNPDAKVEFAYNNSYEDSAAAKTRAEAMISVGCDVIGTDIGAARVGVYEAAAEAGNVLVAGDTSANFAEDYAANVCSVWQTRFDLDVYNAVEKWAKGELEGGVCFVGYDDGVMEYVDSITDAFKKANPEREADITAAWAKVDEAEAAFDAGEIDLEYNTDTPDWKAIVASHQ